MHFDWDWNTAEAELKRAADLNPNYATAHSVYGRLLTTQARFGEAEVAFRRASSWIRFPPGSPWASA
jgi:Tfp pilus assembly protein PilF